MKFFLSVSVYNGIISTVSFYIEMSINTNRQLQVTTESSRPRAIWVPSRLALKPILPVLPDLVLS